ncbi:amino acid--tRNA ligase-related protein [Umezawaea sp. Da 62-37]|uniref:amino acid--tRNA ligase-related protein n=1 Tax=Umezawaea sp. Da 62-37 TaxID=3075927 RepID=UPI0028F73918|nr:amino acid--tRNA ligase-related protein [Umezawaea sp. Da 62-37]WNV85795.1 amino acid--tRNA ligase-related protein [Umezawaea sp. Da 62-37]
MTDTASALRYLAVLDDPWYRCLVAVQDLVSYETAVFWRARGVRCVHLPITTNSVSSPMGLGSDSLPVRVDLFGVPTYLADSMQFMLEYGCRLAPGGCYYLMPSFRGEAADETHLNQFFHSEVEIQGGLDDVMAAADEYVRHLASTCLAQLGDELARVAGGIAHVERYLATPTARITVDEAVAVLTGQEGCVVVNGDDLWPTVTRRGEQRLVELLGPSVWLTHFDHRAVPFYQAHDHTGTRALNADLLLGPGEVVGCGERHVTGDQVRDSLRAHAVAEGDYGWYVDLKSAYPLRTSGFGLGVERLVMWLMACPDIRRTQLVERYNGVLTTP